MKKVYEAPACVAVEPETTNIIAASAEETTTPGIFDDGYMD